MARRKWIKLWCDEWLTGTLRSDKYQDIDLEKLLADDNFRQMILATIIRGIWSDLMALAGDGKYGDVGDIKFAENIGLSDDQIAAILNIPLDLWLWAKEELSQNYEPRLEIDERNVTTVINWSKYQSEYERQKPYRERKKEEEKKKEKKKKTRERKKEESNKEEKKKEIKKKIKEKDKKDLDLDLDKRERSENSNLKLQSEVTKKSSPKSYNLKLLREVTTESYKEKLQKQYPKLDIEEEVLKLSLYYSQDNSPPIISLELTVKNWMESAHAYLYHTPIGIARYQTKSLEETLKKYDNNPY